MNLMYGIMSASVISSPVSVKTAFGLLISWCILSANSSFSSYSNLPDPFLGGEGDREGKLNSKHYQYLQLISRIIKWIIEHDGVFDPHIQQWSIMFINVKIVETLKNR